jgi:tetratricopeptide (TPR) repeat protein
MKKVAYFPLLMLLLALTLSCLSPAQQKVEQGNGYFAKGQWDAAIASYEGALKDDPKVLITNLADAYAGRAEGYIKTGDIDKAILDSNKSIALIKDDARKTGIATAYYDLGKKLAAEKKYDQAVKAFSAAVQFGLKSEQLYCAMGDTLSGKGDYHAAIYAYADALQIKPTMVAALNGRSFAYFTDGTFDKAIIDADKVLEIDPNNTTAYYNRGRAWTGGGDYDLAIAAFGKAITLDKEYADAFFWRAFASYRYKSEYYAAIDDFSKAIELGPSHMKSAYKNPAVVATYPGAMSPVAEMNFGTFETAYNDRAIIYQKLDKPQEAIKDYTRIIEYNPNYLLAYYNRAWSYYLIRQFEMSLADFNKYLEMDMNNSWGLRASSESCVLGIKRSIDGMVQ